MFEIINDTNNDIVDIEIIKGYVNFITKKLDIDKCIFNIIFVNDEEILKINKEYRNIDRVTDVITFALEDSKDDYKTTIRVLGDIYISLDTAYRQAIEYNHSNKREICFLITHGVLHLLGYDHVNSKEEETIMFSLQEDLLNEYEIKR